jgi:hypothetical protein
MKFMMNGALTIGTRDGATICDLQVLAGHRGGFSRKGAHQTIKRATAPLQGQSATRRAPRPPLHPTEPLIDAPAQQSPVSETSKRARSYEHVTACTGQFVVLKVGKNI